MSSVRIARPDRQRIVPAFVVHKLEGKVKKEVHGWDAKGVKTVKEVDVDAGFLVKFPAKGHSIRVRDLDELKRLGFDQTVPLVDANSDDDDVVGEIPSSVLASS